MKELLELEKLKAEIRLLGKQAWWHGAGILLPAVGLIVAAMIAAKLIEKFLA